jgi:hypothetical protein
MRSPHCGLVHRQCRPAQASSAAEMTPVGEIIGSVGHYRFTPGTICRLMLEDYGGLVGKRPPPLRRNLGV